MKRKHKVVLFGLVTIIILALCIISFTSGKAKKLDDRSPKEKQNPIQAQYPIQADVQTRKEPSDLSPIDEELEKEIIDDVGERLLQKVWGDGQAETEVSISVLSAPSEPIMIKFKPPLNVKFQYLTASDTEIGIGGMRSLVRTTLSFDDRTDEGLLITAEEEANWIMPIKEEGIPFSMPKQKKAILFREGQLYPAREVGSSLVVNDNPLNYIERELIKFDFSEDQAVNIGAKWTTGGEGGRPTMVHEVVGYAKVGDMNTVKIVSKGSIGNEFHHLLSKANLLESTAVTSEMISTTYVSLETGLIVRRENNIIMTIGDNMSETNVITQLVRTIERTNQR